MIPRYATGIWWSIWANLDSYDVRQIVNTYETHGIPLDVYILVTFLHLLSLSSRIWTGIPNKAGEDILLIVDSFHFRKVHFLKKILRMQSYAGLA
jgi:hypothetical protein